MTDSDQPAKSADPSATGGTAKADRRNRCLRLLCGAGLALFLALGAFYWTAAAPFLEVRNMVDSCSQDANLAARLLRARKLGTPEQAIGKIRLYLRAPDSLAPRKDTAASFLFAFDESGVREVGCLLHHPDPQVRCGAVHAIGYLYLDAYRDDAEPILRHYALEHSSKGDPDAVAGRAALFYLLASCDEEDPPAKHRHPGPRLERRPKVVKELDRIREVQKSEGTP